MPTTRKTRSKTSSTKKKDERLLCTCSTLLDRGTVRSIADDLLGKMLQSSAGRYYQVMSTRVSGYKIYGQCEEMEESGYMFSPVKQSTLFE